MANDITLPGTGLVVDTIEQSDGSHQQVVQVDGAVVNGLNAAVMLLKDISDTLAMVLPDASGRTRVSVEVMGSFLTLPTVQTVSGITTINGVAPAGGLTVAQPYNAVLLDSVIASVNAAALVNYSFITVS